MTIINIFKVLSKDVVYKFFNK